jgi:hypothetical protein
MYLVELKPGKEELYRTSDELALAIRNGDVDARSRVYHRATAKWISITLHPQYRAIVAAAKPNPDSVQPRRPWALFAESTGQVLETTQATIVQASQQLHRWRRPIALGVSGILLLSGMQLAFSGSRSPSSESGRAVAVEQETERVELPSTPEKIEYVAEFAREDARPVASVDALADSQPRPEESNKVQARRRGTTVAALPRAPRLRSKLLSEALVPGRTQPAAGNSLDGLLSRYSAAHDSARSRLERGMRVAMLNRLFALSRLSPGGGITDTRMNLAGAANLIRAYRQQQTLIESAYQDTVTAMAKEQGWSPKQVRAWYSRAPRKEAPTLESLSGSLVTSIDSVLGVLAAHAGAYKLRGTAIAFEDPAAGQAYGALRRRIKEQIDAAVAAGGALSAGPAGLLLQAIGTTSLPRET